MQMEACFFSEAPVQLGEIRIPLALQVLRFTPELGHITDPPRPTHSCRDTRFRLGHFGPTAMVQPVMELHLLQRLHTMKRPSAV
jgi:hypothetical protein